MRAILLAQGTGNRWQDASGSPYLGRPKQLVEIDGATLLGRTVRLLTARGVAVTVVGPDERFRVGGADFATLENPRNPPNDMAKFLNTRHLWSQDGRTLMLWGDCFYTEDAVSKIVNHPESDLHYFRRTGSSDVTGHKWDESFAVTWDAEYSDTVARIAEKVNRDWQSKKIKHRKRAGHIPIRNHQAAALGLPYDRLDLLTKAPNQTVINDWTDDFDSPYDYRSWTGRYFAGKINLGVCIPWFGGDHYRVAAKNAVAEHYRRIGVPVYFGEDDTRGRWTNRARGCNNAAKKAISAGHDVLLMGDADTIIPAEQLWAAAHAATMTGSMVIGYTEYWKHRRTATGKVVEGKPLSELTRVARWQQHVSGAFAMGVPEWLKLGGFDERFDSWGGEDRALWKTSEVLLGKSYRIDGVAHHLWHPESPQKDARHPNRKAMLSLGHRYKRATGWLTAGGTLGRLADSDADPDYDALVALLREPGGPWDGRP